MNTTHITEKAAQLGYEVVIREGAIRFVIPMDRQGAGYYTPEVVAPSSYDEDQSWKIQTCSYGSLVPSDIDKLVDGMKRAQQMVSYLENWGI